MIKLNVITATVLFLVTNTVTANNTMNRSDAIQILSDLRIELWVLEEQTQHQRDILLKEIRTLQKAILSKKIKETP